MPVGYRLAEGAYQQWGHLSNREMRGLVYMALRANDSDSIYRWGADELAQGMGFSGDSANHSAMKVIVSLRKAGALSVITQGYRGNAAKYKLAVTPVSKSTKKHAHGGHPTDLESMPTVGTHSEEKACPNEPESMPKRARKHAHGGHPIRTKELKEHSSEVSTGVQSEPAATNTRPAKTPISKLLKIVTQKIGNLPEQTMTELGQQINKLQKDGINEQHIIAGLKRWCENNYPPSTLDRDVTAAIKNTNTPAPTNQPPGHNNWNNHIRADHTTPTQPQWWENLSDNPDDEQDAA